MAAYLVDSNIVSYLFDTASRSHRAVRQAFEAAGDDDRLCLSVLSLYELHAVASASGFALPHDRILSAFEIRPVPPDGAHRFAALKHGLRTASGLTAAAAARHNIDLMLAATALAESLTMVSNDAIFSRIAAIEPALSLVNWAAPDRAPTPG